MKINGYLIKENQTITLLLRNEVNCEKIEISYRNVKNELKSFTTTTTYKNNYHIDLK